MVSAEELVLAECSDEEEFDRQGISLNNVWSPKLELIEGLYTSVKGNKGVLELEWKCPGRRDPQHQNAEESQVTAEPEQSSSMNDMQADDFAFEMEDESPTKSVTKTPKSAGPIFKSKAKTPRTTTLAGILSNMERHRIIEKLEGTDISTSKSPPASNQDS